MREIKWLKRLKPKIEKEPPEKVEQIQDDDKTKEKGQLPAKKDPAKKDPTIEKGLIGKKAEKPKATPEQVAMARKNSRKRFLKMEIQRDHYAGDSINFLAELSKMPLGKIDEFKTTSGEARDLINKRGEEIGSLVNFLSKDSDETLKKIFRGNLEKLQKLGAFSPHSFVRESLQVKREASSIEQKNRLIMQVFSERKITEEIVEPKGVEEKKFTEQEKQKNLKKILEENTKEATKEIAEQDIYINSLQEKVKGKKIDPNYAEEQIRHSERGKRIVEEYKKQWQKEIKSQIADFKKISPDDLRERIKNNKEEMEEIGLYLELGKGIVDEKNMPSEKKILKQETPILEAIQKGEI